MTILSDGRKSVFIRTNRGAPRMSNYISAKHGLHGLTKSIAFEWLRYGWVDTRLTGTRETGEEMLGHPVGIPEKVRENIITQRQGNAQIPEEAANTALLLALPEAQHVTATVLNATSGW